MLHETELDSDGNVKRNRLGVVVELELNPASSSESNTLGNRIVDTLPVNPVTVGKESIPVFAGFNDQGSVSNSELFYILAVTNFGMQQTKLLCVHYPVFLMLGNFSFHLSAYIPLCCFFARHCPFI